MIYLTGDLHGEKQQIQIYLEQLASLSKEDLLIITGDFGLLWWDPQKICWRHYQDMKLIKKLADAPFTTCFIDGNHENFDLLETYPVEEKWGGKVQNIEGVYHLLRGEIYEIEGKRLFTFGGASSTDKERRQAHISWWPQEVCSKAEQNQALQTLEKYSWQVDYAITHTAPKQFQDLYARYVIGKHPPCPTAEFLTQIHEKLTYNMWYFGHFHGDELNKTLKAHLLFDSIIELGE